jgi:hypothetical protein
MRDAIGKLKSLQPGDPSLIVNLEVWFGFALLESGAARQAESLFRDALAFRRANLAANHPRIAEAECGLGGALGLLGRPREAEALLARSLPVFRSWGLADPVSVRRLEKQLAEIP